MLQSTIIAAGHGTRERSAGGPATCGVRFEAPLAAALHQDLTPTLFLSEFPLHPFTTFSDGSLEAARRERRGVGGASGLARRRKQRVRSWSPSSRPARSSRHEKSESSTLLKFRIQRAFSTLEAKLRIQTKTSFKTKFHTFGGRVSNSRGESRTQVSRPPRSPARERA